MAKGCGGGLQDGNYIKINRSILEWEWYRNINTKVLFLHMLLKAYWKDTRIEGKLIERGSFVSSVKSLSYETMLTENEIRTAIKHLKTTGELTSKGTNKNTVFTVNNYDKYQSINEQKPKQETNEAQPINKPLTTNKEYKENKEVKKDTMCEINNLFEKVWQLYPVKRGKGQVSAAAKKRLHKIGYEEIARAIERYKEYVDGIDYLQYQNGGTFFNSGYIDYLDDEYTPGQATVYKSKKSNNFNNGEQRNYDFDSLERELSSN